MMRRRDLLRGVAAVAVAAALPAPAFAAALPFRVVDVTAYVPGPPVPWPRAVELLAEIHAKIAAEFGQEYAAGLRERLGRVRAEVVALWGQEIADLNELHLLCGLSWKGVVR